MWRARATRLIALCLVCFALAGCNERQTLYSGLTQKEANEMVVVLKRSGIDGALAPDARGGTLTLQVATERMPDAVDALTRAGLPRQKQSSLQDVLPRDTWMVSPSEERARLAYAVSQELTTTLSKIPGVMETRVHVALGERNALGQLTTPTSASVLVHFDADVLSQGFAENIRALVTTSVSGLAYDRVTVTMIPAEAAVNAKPIAASFVESSVLDDVTRVLKFGLIVAGGAYLLLRLVRGRA